MLTRKIDTLVWMALTDGSFRERLLSGHGRDVVSQLGFSELEQQALLAIKADTLEAFAGALCPPVLQVGAMAT